MKLKDYNILSITEFPRVPCYLKSYDTLKIKYGGEENVFSLLSKKKYLSKFMKIYPECKPYKKTINDLANKTEKEMLYFLKDIIIQKNLPIMPTKKTDLNKCISKINYIFGK